MWMPVPRWPESVVWVLLSSIPLHPFLICLLAKTVAESKKSLQAPFSAPSLPFLLFFLLPPLLLLASPSPPQSLAKAARQSSSQSVSASLKTPSLIRGCCPSRSIVCKYSEQP